MVVVKAKPGERPDRLIARFKKKVLQSGLLIEMKERERHKTKAEHNKEEKYRIKYQREMDRKRELEE